jgi:hypothetical protein
MSGDPFFMNDRTGTPNAQNTVEGLSMILPKLKAKPFIMSSSGPASAPKLIMKAPYFQGNKGVNFNYKFEPNKDFCFYIFVNNFKQTFSSHAMVGWWRSGELILFDPNGDFSNQDNESVYSGFAYLRAPTRSNLKNPLYNTLLDYFRLPKMKVYTGTPISCPMSKSGTCVYRALMYILGIHKSNNPVEVVRYTSKLAKTEFKAVKEIAEVSEIYQIFPNEEVLVDFKRLIEKMSMNNSSSSNNYRSV